MKGKPSGADHFEVGERHCLLTLKPVGACDHCAWLPRPMQGEKVKVTDVNYQTGVITMEMTVADALEAMKP